MIVSYLVTITINTEKPTSVEAILCIYKDAFASAKDGDTYTTEEVPLNTNKELFTSTWMFLN